MKQPLVLLTLVLGACASRTAPGREVPYCLSECPAPEPAAVVSELSVTVAPPASPTQRTVVTGEELDRILSNQRAMPRPRPAVLWVLVDSAGLAREIRVAESSGSERSDESLVQSAAGVAFDVDAAGWYRVRVEPRAR